MKLPIFIQRRLYPFRNYVADKLFPDAQVGYLLKNKNTHERKIILKKINMVITECSYVCFIFSLKQFFEEGTKSAEKAVKIYNELGIDKFYIGKKDYSKDNLNVNEGRRLYEIMVNSLSDNKLRELIKTTSYYSQIIDRYKNVSI